MSLTTNPNDPNLKEELTNGQNKSYLVLSDEEIKKGFVRPVRESYIHIGTKIKGTLRDLTKEEINSYVHEEEGEDAYFKFEEYPETDSSIIGKYWTKKQCDQIKNGYIGGCGAETRMNLKIAETYARNPKFYGSTFCVVCGKHLPVEEFVWEDGSVLGS